MEIPGFAKALRALGRGGSNLAVADATTGSDGLMAASESPAAPDFTAGTWINSEPLTLKTLRGRVVLIEFWTFGCYSCRNTLPSVNAGMSATQ